MDPIPIFFHGKAQRNIFSFDLLKPNIETFLNPKGPLKYKLDLYFYFKM